MKTKSILIIIIIIIILAIGYVVLKPAPAAQNNPSPTPTARASSTPIPSASSSPNTNSYDIQGMKVEILRKGTGPAAKNGDHVTVNYVGTLLDGRKFDSSIDRGTPFPFTLGAGQVIKGWDLGVVGMKAGEKRKLTIPPELGYGSNAVPGSIIGANATLVFEVDLLTINK